LGQARESASATADGIALVFPAALASSQQPAYSQTQSSWELTTPEVEQLIKDGIRSESMLESAKVEVRTDDSVVALTGTVASAKQRELADEIARAYSGHRRIQNQIKVSGS
jgi:hyperosmotically inducible protein